VASRSTSATSNALARSAFVESTADLFRAARLADPGPIRRFTAPGGTDVSSPTATPGGSGLPDVIEPFGIDQAPGSFGYGGGHVGTSERFEIEPYQMDEIVERVIARIEQRVVDELERRGRRFTPGVF
jgi:hypothetical protein